MPPEPFGQQSYFFTLPRGREQGKGSCRARPHLSPLPEGEEEDVHHEIHQFNWCLLVHCTIGIGLSETQFRRRALLPRQNTARHRRFRRRRRQRHRRALDNASFAAPYCRQSDYHRRKHAGRRRDRRHQLCLWQSQSGRAHRAVCHRHTDQSIDRDCQESSST